MIIPLLVTQDILIILMINISNQLGQRSCRKKEEKEEEQEEEQEQKEEEEDEEEEEEEEKEEDEEAAAAEEEEQQPKSEVHLTNTCSQVIVQHHTNRTGTLKTTVSVVTGVGAVGVTFSAFIYVCNTFT